MDWNKILEDQESVGLTSGPVPEGKYPVKVDSAEAVKASTGAEMIKLTLEVQGGPNDRPIWTNIVFSVDNPNAMRFTLRKLTALGVSREYLSAHNPSTAEIAKLITGVVTEADVSLREWEGEKRNDVKSFRSLNGAGEPVATAGVAAPDIPIPSIPAPPTPVTEAPPIPTPPAPGPEPEQQQIPIPALDDSEPF